MTNNDQLYEQIKDLVEANLAPIRKDIKEINYAIKGNGQPGLTQKVENLEAWRWKVVGIVTTIMFFLSFFGEEVRAAIFK